MHNSDSVGFCQSFSDMLQISEKLRELGLLAMNFLAECHAIDELHCDVISAVTLADFVNVRDVGMIECGRSLRLSNKSLHAVVIGGNVSKKDLHGNLTFKFCVLCQIHLTHSARSQLGNDAVVRNRRVCFHLRHVPGPVCAVLISSSLMSGVLQKYDKPASAFPVLCRALLGCSSINSIQFVVVLRCGDCISPDNPGMKITYFNLPAPGQTLLVDTHRFLAHALQSGLQ